MDSESKFEQLDAVRNPIKLGERYGYSSSSSGWSKTVIGTARKITKTGMVSLIDLTVHQFLYGKVIDSPYIENAKNVSVRPHLLFPVSSENA